MMSWRRIGRGWWLAVVGMTLGGGACGREIGRPTAGPGDSARTIPEPAFAAPPSLESVPPVATTADAVRGNSAAGRLIYATYCVQCHGMRGAGDGRLARSLSPRPGDLRWLDLPRQANQVLAALKTGVPPQQGAFMPHWGKAFSDQQLWDVIAYLPALAARR